MSALYIMFAAIMFSGKKREMEIKSTVIPVYNGHPWDPKIVAAVHRWALFRGFSIKIDIEFYLAVVRLAVVDRWPLFRGGR